MNVRLHFVPRRASQDRIPPRRGRRRIGALAAAAALAARIRTRTSGEPSVYAFAIYDAVWVVARAQVAAGAALGIEELKQAFTAAAARHYGATGWTVLNEAGDRRHGDYDFWAIRMEGAAPEWSRVAQYESRTGRLFRW